MKLTALFEQESRPPTKEEAYAFIKRVFEPIWHVYKDTEKYSPERHQTVWATKYSSEVQKRAFGKMSNTASNAAANMNRVFFPSFEKADTDVAEFLVLAEYKYYTSNNANYAKYPTYKVYFRVPSAKIVDGTATIDDVHWEPHLTRDETQIFKDMIDDTSVLKFPSKGSSPLQLKLAFSLPIEKVRVPRKKKV